MSQMLVRIDDETDKALIYIYENKWYVSLNQFGVIPLSIALAFIGEYECALLGIILVRLMLMGKK